MSSTQRKDWREEETLEEAARRLIGVMDERAKRRLAGGQNGPAEIHRSSASPLEKAADSESVGLGSLDRCPPVNAARGGQGSDHIATTQRQGSNGLEGRCGQVFSDVLRRRPVEDAGITTTCPRSDAEMIADRFTVQYGNVRQRDEE
jgi:hypothetical protein